MADPKAPPRITRRSALKRAAYVVPAVLTLPATPAFASAGSSSTGKAYGKGHQKGGNGSRGGNQGKKKGR
ncbi:MAG TPA: hypothetical protein VNN07_01610 [Candidatus Tectomicrobia bacterium]|nr:hypothetical protein [Candidatus Tectomicrobia bacterium]